MNRKGIPRRVIWVSLILMIGWASLLTPAANATETPAVMEVKQGSRITANIENSRLSEVLRLMAEKSLLEIRGSVPSREDISIHFADLSLEEALRKLLRGYNYALFETEGARPPTLIVMGRVTSGGGSFGPVSVTQAASDPALPAITPNAGQTISSVLTDAIPERPTKTRRALPTKLASHLASIRSMAIQSKSMPTAASTQQAEEATEAGANSEVGAQTEAPVETPKAGQPADTTGQSESTQAGEQGQ